MLSSCNKQPWQLTAGNAGECNTLIVNFECGSQENGNAPGSGRLATASGVPAACFQWYCLLQVVTISRKRLSYLCHDRPGLSSKTLAAGWLHFAHFQGQWSNSPVPKMEKLSVPISQPSKGLLSGTVVLFSIERLSIPGIFFFQN